MTTGDDDSNGDTDDEDMEEEPGVDVTDRLFPESEAVDDAVAETPPVDSQDEPTVKRDTDTAIDQGDLTEDSEPESTPSESTDGEPGSEGPLNDLADRVREQEERAVEDDDLFETVEVGGVDEEALWEQVTTEEGYAVEAPEDREDVVEKSAYCEQCEFFTGPPRTRCTHEGTQILEMVDLEQFRVRNCPVVLEEEALENIND